MKINKSGLECTCDYCQKRKKARCAHGMAVEILLVKNMFEIQPGDEEYVIDDCIQIQCSKGHTTGITRAGKRGRKYREDAQMYKCATCDCKFTWDELGFENLRYPPEIVTLALSLFLIGDAPEDISVVISYNMDTNVHESTIERWAKKFITFVELYAQTLPIRTGGIWSADEKLLLAIKNLSVEKQYWLFTIMDQYTRFILMHHVSPRKDNYNVDKLFKGAKSRAGCTPAILKSDRLPAFRNACNRVYGTKIGSDALHWCDCHLRGEFKENNCQERVNSTLDSLIRTKRSIKSYDSIIIRGAILYYNYLRPHRGINKKTPAQMARLTIKGSNPLKTLIQNAIPDALRKNWPLDFKIRRQLHANGSESCA